MKFSGALCFVIALIAGFIAVMPATVLAQNASEIVESTSTQVVARLKEQKAQLDADPSQIYEVINELVLPHFDFYNISRYVLGNAWNQANEQQQQAFIKEFQTLLVRTYANALRQYSDNEIKYHPEQASGNRLVVVRTEVRGISGSKTVPINYRMHSIDGAWKVVDVTVDGVSLVSTYRGSFATEIRNKGMDALIARLAEKNRNPVPATAAE